MKVEFTENDTPFRKGETYDLPTAEARKFIRHGVASEVGKPSKRKRKSGPDIDVDYNSAELDEES
jgi:hypothetical protein